MSDSQRSARGAAMGHVQPAVSGCPLLEQADVETCKRPLEPLEPAETPPGKRARQDDAVWRQETPPPSPQESSEDSERSEDESEDDEDSEDPGYQGSSILASCLLSDRRTTEPAFSPACELGRAGSATYSGWYADGCATQRPQNQTVECDGKSYIQLGAVPPRRERSQLYRYQRFTALHATMVKLGRHRRMVDPPLRKSVLLFNTMRHIERELEQDGLTLAAAFNPHQFDSGTLTLDPPPPTPPPAASAGLPPSAGAACSPGDSDSGLGDLEINWSSVLSLGSQPELELTPLDAQLTPLSADDVLRTFPAEAGECSVTAAAALSSLLAL